MTLLRGLIERRGRSASSPLLPQSSITTIRCFSRCAYFNLPVFIPAHNSPRVAAVPLQLYLPLSTDEKVSRICWRKERTAEAEVSVFQIRGALSVCQPISPYVFPRYFPRIRLERERGNLWLLLFRYSALLMPLRSPLLLFPPFVLLLASETLVVVGPRDLRRRPSRSRSSRSFLNAHWSLVMDGTIWRDDYEFLIRSRRNHYALSARFTILVVRA